MLTQADKDTGQKLSCLSIRQQMLTFLAAGYDTTSGMLMWTIYYLPAEKPCGPGEMLRRGR